MLTETFETCAQRLAPLLLPLLLAACAAGPTPNARPDLALLTAAAPAARITLSSFDGQAELTGNSAGVQGQPKPDGTRNAIGAQVVAGPGSAQALELLWKGAWYAELRVESLKPQDLQPYLGGTLEFDMQVAEMASGGLRFKMDCGPGCVRPLWFVEQARAAVGKGWQHVALPMSCFMRDGADFSRVQRPLGLEVVGEGRLSLSAVHHVVGGKGNMSCPDYRTESVTPAPQVDTWTQAWWPQRHAQKLREARELNPEIVFIGDSITQGWEGVGREVWQRHFAKYRALNLGFSGDHTENVLWRLQHGEIDGIAPKVAVLMIGTNNTGNRLEDPQTTAAGVNRIVDEIRQRLPQTKLLLLAVFPRDERPDGQMRRINERLSALISGYADGRSVHFLNINPALLNTDGSLSREIMPDGLHPGDKGYTIWQRAMDGKLQQLLSKPTAPAAR